MIIDATDMIAGRIATVAAKKALLGEDIIIVNCEKAVITGNRLSVLADYKRTKERGIPLKGPYFHRKSDKIMRRIVRGMLPYKQEKGRIVYEKVICYRGVPSELTGKKFETIKGAGIGKLPNTKYVYIGEISKFLGAKQ